MLALLIQISICICSVKYDFTNCLKDFIYQNGLLTFLKILERYSREYDWERLRRLTDRNGDVYDIFDQYGQISIEDIIWFQTQNIWNAPILRANIGAINQKKLRLTYMHQKFIESSSAFLIYQIFLKCSQSVLCNLFFMHFCIAQYNYYCVYTLRNSIQRITLLISLKGQYL